MEIGASLFLIRVYPAAAQKGFVWGGGEREERVVHFSLNTEFLALKALLIILTYSIFPFKFGHFRHNTFV